MTSIDFEITLDDIHAFNQHFARTSPVSVRARRLARFGLTFVLSALFISLATGFRLPLPAWRRPALLCALLRPRSIRASR